MGMTRRRFGIRNFTVCKQLAASRTRFGFGLANWLASPEIVSRFIFFGSDWRCVEGRRLFSPRRGTDSRARNGGGYAAIRAGFTVALRSCGNSSVERATAATLVWEGWWLPLP
ncbi:hypothetical protein BHE74_00034570 [Ensete ventricosum]|nr:hypothetical protein BHE74_00034570 [Ensete ventricosum]